MVSAHQCSRKIPRHRSPGLVKLLLAGGCSHLNTDGPKPLYAEPRRNHLMPTTQVLGARLLNIDGRKPLYDLSGTKGSMCKEAKQPPMCCRGHLYFKTRADPVLRLIEVIKIPSMALRNNFVHRGQALLQDARGHRFMTHRRQPCFETHRGHEDSTYGFAE